MQPYIYNRRMYISLPLGKQMNCAVAAAAAAAGGNINLRT